MKRLNIIGSEKTRMIIMGAVIAILFLVMIFRMVMGKKPSAVEPNEPVVIESNYVPPAQTKPKDNQAIQYAQEVLLKQPWGRNSFARASEEEIEEFQRNFQTSTFESHRDLILKGIMIRKERRVALINGQFLREGAEIDGAMVKNIWETEVILEKNQEEIILKVGAR